MTIIRFGPGGRRQAGDHKVYIRRVWSDDWTEYTAAHCTDAVWAASPTMPTATILWPYGVVKTPYSTSYTINTKLTVSRWYVKVVFTTDVSAGDTATWYGIVSDIQDDQAGYVAASGTYHPTGQQILHCHGLERLLTHEIRESRCDIGEEALHDTPLPITFNANGIGNRNANQRPLGDADAAYVFDGIEEESVQTSYETNVDWSTRRIVEYLLRWQGPSRTSNAYNRSVPFRLVHGDRLNDLDSPIVPQEGATPLSILQRLIDRRRLMSFRLTVDEGSNEVQLDPFSFSASGIDFGLADVHNVPANNEQYDIYYEWDEMTRVSVRQVDAQAVDRVIARGARRTSTFTAVYADGRFEAGWTSTDETAYETAASGDANYATWDLKDQPGRNMEVRAQEDLQPVYSWFRVPDDWDGLVEEYDTTGTNPVFIDDDGRWIEEFYTPGLRLLPHLPLYVGIDYSNDAIANDTMDNPRDPTYRRPFAAFKRPNDGRYVHGERIAQLSEGDYDPVGDGLNLRWSAYVRPQPLRLIAEVHVTGEPQHVIAETDFTPLTADRDLGDFDYKDKEMLVTLAIQECRYAEASYPAAGIPDSTGVDAQRAHVIHAGDWYRQDYVVPGTVLDVDNSGAIIESYGGYVRDDTEQLEAIARVAYEWYTTDRAVLALTTQRLLNDLSIGDMISTAGDITITSSTTHSQAINSPITSIRIRTPKIPPNSVSAPEMTIITGAGELDPMTMLPPRGRRLG